MARQHVHTKVFYKGTKLEGSFYAWLNAISVEQNVRYKIKTTNRKGEYRFCRRLLQVEGDMELIGQFERGPKSLGSVNVNHVHHNQYDTN